MKEGKNNTVLLTVIGIATLLVAVVGATFAYFSAQLSGTENQSTMTIQASNGGSSTLDGGEAIVVKDIYPRDEAWVNKKIAVTYDNTTATSGTYDYNVGLHYTNGYQVVGSSYDIQYTITEGYCEGKPEALDQAACGTAGGTWNRNVASQGTVTKQTTDKTGIPAGTGNLTEIASGKINLPANGVKHYYTLRIYFVNDTTRNQIQGAEFTAYAMTEQVNG